MGEIDLLLVVNRISCAVPAVPAKFQARVAEFENYMQVSYPIFGEIGLNPEN